ncbi:MAG: cupin domain-containing protein [Bradymonadia bacterium]
MTARKHPHIASLEHTPREISRRGKHHFKQTRLALAAGASQLGVSHVELPPGKRSWPRHWHAANEEGIYVLSGRGVARIGDEAIEVGPGDYVACLTGPEHAHQMINTGDEPLKYLCISTMHATDICGYPDSKKIGVFGGAAPGGQDEDRYIFGFMKADEYVGYWEGEE